MTQQHDDGSRDSNGRRVGQQPFRGGSSGGRFGQQGPRGYDDRRSDNRRAPPRFGQGQYGSRPPQDRDSGRDDWQNSAPPPALEFPIGKTSRQVALATLMTAVNSDEYVTDHLERAFVRSDLPPIERRLATELTFGVVRRKATLDAILEKSVNRPRAQVETALWMLLRLGVYQLAICDGIPAHAACDETVELARWMGRPEWVSFANGVLRGITRTFSPAQIDVPTSRSIPTTFGRFRLLEEPTFADPADKQLAYLAKAFSLPLWLLERWSTRFDFAELCRLGFWFNTPSPLCLRVNTLRTDRETLLAAFAAAGIAARPGDLPSSIWLGTTNSASAEQQSAGESVASVDLLLSDELDAAANDDSSNLSNLTSESSPDVSETALEVDESALDLNESSSDENRNATEESSDADNDTAATQDGEPQDASIQDATQPTATSSITRRDAPVRIDRLPGFNEGWFVVQDESAQRVAVLLAPQPGEIILDLCSAPGTKTTHIAELMRNEGRIIATDVSEERLKRVDENCRRLGITIVETKVISNETLDLPEGPFDAILIDAPCSNTGVLGKRPDARWRIQADDLEELSRIQLRLILAAADRLKPGGRILYSTCSIEPDENTAVVEAVGHFRKKLTLEMTNELIPGRPADGGFQSLLRST